MRARASKTYWLTLLVFIAAMATGCRKEEPAVQPATRKPVPKTLTLRVVMFVETGANLANPTSTTGGCRLTDTEVTNSVNDLVKFAPNCCPTLTFAWDGTIEKLESTCMKVQPPPLPPCTSVCGDVTFQNKCPRKMPDVWFLFNVVNQFTGGPADLQQHDNYSTDPKTINIYFVGNAVIGPNQALGFGFTIPPNQQGIPPCVVMNDGALDQADAPGNATRLKNRETLLHEVAAHWLTGTGVHPTDLGDCPDNLFIFGPQFDRCEQQYGGKHPIKILKSSQDLICQRLSQLP